MVLVERNAILIFDLLNTLFNILGKVLPSLYVRIYAEAARPIFTKNVSCDRLQSTRRVCLLHLPRAL